MNTINKHFKRRLSNSSMIILGFFLIIVLGSLLLFLPVSTKSSQSTSYIGALFTAVSSTCVTGLIVYDTYTHWTLFGQIVILILIQIGGLGFITIISFLMIKMKKVIGLNHRVLIQESLNTLNIRGGVKLIKRVVIGTFIIELLGAIILSIRFIPELGFGKGIYYGIFHSISAFCNAGFDLMGFREQYSSFCYYYNDSVVIITLSLLILIGGIGFLVWDDLIKNKFNFKKYSLHTKIVLSSTLIITILSTVLFILFENDYLFSSMNFNEKLLSGLFSSITPRTAGFNSVDTANLSNGSKIITLLLMFIGGSPGSTAGGIKTTTFFVVILYVSSYIKRQKDCVCFKSRIETDAIKKACIVIFINLSLICMGLLIIFASQNIDLTDVLFEVFSACGTVGMSTGITRQLNTLSKGVIILLMFCGRMGSLTFAMTLTESRKETSIRYPEEQITIG